MADSPADVTAAAPAASAPRPDGRGLRFDRFFTPPGSQAYDLIEWERRTAAITNAQGKVFFEQKGVEVPRGWSQLAGNIVAQKYFWGRLGTPERETSVRQLVDRVVDALVGWGRAGGYFATEQDAESWGQDLRWLLVTQHASFNSPVWFNIGIPGRSQQASACFINSVEDTMESILELAKTEGMLFKFGSGTGTNLSVLRSSQEALAGGGTASGPVSFMRGYDSFAGSIKSGGTTRRAAKMVILNADHPDIGDFVRCKAEEEKKAWALIEAGYDAGFNVPGGAYDSVQFQNANHSVRVTDGFMHALEEGADWTTHAVTDGRPMKTMKAADLWKEIAEAAWVCGDPGVQFDTTIQGWNTVPNTGRINATNPCFTGDALVHTTKGLVPIAEVVARAAHGEMFSVYTHDLTHPEHPFDAVAISVPDTFMVTGYHDVVRLRFSNGMEVRCTPNHRFFTRNRGYVRADELSSADRVVTLDRVTPAAAASYELPVSTEAERYRTRGDHTSMTVEFPKRWTPEFAHFLGWLVGDGCISLPLETVISVYGTAEEQLEVLPLHREVLATLSGGFEGRVSNQRNGTRQIRTGRKAIARFLTALGLSDGRAATKVVPWSIMEAPADIAAAFLRGLFDADGCARDGGDKGRYVGLGSRSRRLLIGAQQLLSTFGVFSRIYTVRKQGDSFTYVRKDGQTVSYGSDGPMYDLRITAGSMRRFRDEIGFGLPRKAGMLDGLLSHDQYATDTTTALIDRVEDGVELTYNLREPRNHSYIVNGLVVANCSEFVFTDDTACFAPETRISTPAGLRTVESLYRAQEAGQPVLVTTDLHSEHDHRRLTAHRPARVTEVGRRPVVRMTLADGRRIRATADHRFLTSDGWKRVDQLRIGQDRVQLRESGNGVAFTSSAADVRRWRMFGWLTGDGMCEMHIAADFNLLEAESAAGRPGLALRESQVGTQPNGVMQITCSRASVVRTLEETYGFTQATAIDKDVPALVHHVPEDLRVAYLQGLFSADGCMRDNVSGTEPEVMLASSSAKLLRSVQLMLSDLGITARVGFSHPAGRKNPQGQLHIYNQQMRKFLALVGFPCSDEKRALADRVLNTRFAGARKNPRASQVLSVEPDGVETVYDVTEPVTHSLIAEGMVAHNCNLLSLNLRKFQNQDATVDAEKMKRAVDICFTAQEILVSNASYPTSKIAQNSERLRPLGLGYANLGALLMSMGHAYDSPDGRAVAGAVTALITGEAYAQSARMAAVKGPFSEFSRNREPMLGVMRKHQAAARELPATGDTAPLAAAAREAWSEAITLGERHGYRNAQATVIAPTGTVSLMMDCDTTGIEPDLALVKYKTLVGGGSLKIVNATVPTALSRLGYGEDEIRAIVAYVDAHDTIEGAPGLRAEDLPVFDCAFRPLNGKRTIAPMGHVRMMAAVQPFVSGSQSKTVNLPNDATAEDIAAIYRQSWSLGLKCIAIYRDGCKRSQPLSTSEQARKKTPAQAAPSAPAPVAPEPRPYRRRLPDERTAITHKFEIQGHEGYITVGMYPDGKPGEVFIKMAKEGSTISGLMDALATQTSVALQYGVPLEVMVNKFSHMRFEPAGMTRNRQIPIAKSIVDYIFRWLASRFLDEEAQDAVGVIRRDDDPPRPVPGPPPLISPEAAPPLGPARLTFATDTDAPSCAECGSITVRSGACYKCLNCGATTGCG